MHKRGVLACRYPHLIRGKALEVTDGKSVVKWKDGSLERSDLENAQKDWVQSLLKEAKTKHLLETGIDAKGCSFFYKVRAYWSAVPPLRLAASKLLPNWCMCQSEAAGVCLPMAQGNYPRHCFPFPSSRSLLFTTAAENEGIKHRHREQEAKGGHVLLL